MNYSLRDITAFNKSVWNTVSHFFIRRGRMFFALLLLLLFNSSVSRSQIGINELGIAPSSATNGNGGEFIELFNKSGAPVDIGCYVLIFSGTSGGGNPTGWTITIPLETIIAPGGYFLIGGLGQSSGATWTSLPIGGISWVNAYGANGKNNADLDISTSSNTALNSTNAGGLQETQAEKVT